MGFSSGLPLALTGSTIQAWMKEENISLEVIGLFSLVGLPYTLKFLWAPLLDLSGIKIFGYELGKRRSWILLSQVSLSLLVFVLSLLNPSSHSFYLACVALMIAFMSATQDIVIDAYRTEVLVEKERGAGASISNLGYRLAMITSGAIALMLADILPWPKVFMIMSGLLLGCSIVNFFAEEPIAVKVGPKTINQAVLIPLKDFFTRVGSIEILVFILIYKIDIVMAVALTTPFMMEMGFSKTEIGAVTKGIGMLASIAGSLCGGALYPKLGLKKCLLYFGMIQGVSTLTFSVLALSGKNTWIMAFAVGFENFCAGLATTAFIALLMKLCNPGYAATSFALLSSFASVSRVFAGAPTGWLVSYFGWVNFFVVCALSAIPGLLLLVYRFDHWFKETETTEPTE